VQASLPPSLRSVAIQHCGSSKSADVLLYLGSHPVLEVIQFNDADGGAATVFQQWQALGRIRKEIQVHLVSAFAAYARQRNLQNLVNYPLQWIDVSNGNPPESSPLVPTPSGKQQTNSTLFTGGGRQQLTTTAVSGAAVLLCFLWFLWQ
jgi:hypothetical protein